MEDERTLCGSSVYLCAPGKEPVWLNGSVSMAAGGSEKGERPEGYEMRAGCMVKDVDAGLARMLQGSMRFDRRTLRRLFHAVTHHKQVRFDVMAEFGSGTVVHAYAAVETPRSLRLLLNRIRHIRTPYKITDRED